MSFIQDLKDVAMPVEATLVDESLKNEEKKKDAFFIWRNKMSGSNITGFIFSSLVFRI